jgi:hypothetical protein
MAADSGMLSQEEIDALFQKATGMTIHHRSSTPPAEESVPVAAPARAPVAAPAPAPVPAPQPAAFKPKPMPEPVMPPPAAVPEPEVPMPKVIIRNADAVQALTSQPAVPTVSKAAMDATVKQFQSLTNTLTKRLLEAEKRIAQLERQNKTLASKLNSGSSANIAAIVKEVKRIGGQVKTISGNLEATPGYNVHNTFVCTSCGSKGKVAVPMRCTECGQEGWKGWFRKK